MAGPSALHSVGMPKGGPQFSRRRRDLVGNESSHFLGEGGNPVRSRSTRRINVVLPARRGLQTFFLQLGEDEVVDGIPAPSDVFHLRDGPAPV